MSDILQTDTLRTLGADVEASSVRILVVDDEESMVDLVCCMLHNLNVEASRASGSRQARHYLEEGRYDLLVTDLQMPDMNGFDLAGWAKSSLLVDKVVIMTACPEVEEYRALIPSPVDCWLFKPFTFTEFTTVIRSMLGPGARY
jgi:DNA-binding response OmpR family regulator